ncbi:MAG TPA: NADH-quinone oxidoreductase subunit L [Solirubrobacteraceae bacterium]|nr:NADH-quinone oxidoreductase subunit L [Solirubrobacteraceae bacterium]
MSATTFGWLVLACPLVGSILIGFGYARWPGRLAGWIATFAIALSFVFAVLTLIKLLGMSPDHRQLTSSLWNYDVSAGVDAKLEILVDPLSVFMILVVSGVSTLIHLYSVSYMTDDRGYSRYFSYLNYFVFSMLLLVLAGNFVLLIVGWAFVGAASYLLISFWYRRTTATRAGIKAFVINVVGDVGLVIATFIIFGHTGTVQFLPVFHSIHQHFAYNGAPIVVACLLLLVGAFAKSAQVPLHTWLPDAMEGPTPVSALIHAATMVTAGVYLIARMHVLFEWAPTAADVGAIGGCLTLVLAATVALVMTDIKRVIAYSTMSQIGYMIMGVCVGAYSAGLFHLMTHAFFKALLFMAAGSIIGAMSGDQSLEHMSGFRKALPFTFVMFIVGGLALSGMPPFSGWLSKDDIIGFLDHRGGGFEILGIVGYAGALLTGIYTFRMIFRAFFNEPCEEARELEHGHLHHADVPRNPMTGEEEDTDVGFPGPGHFIAEREMPMKVAMSALAVLAVIGGVVQIPGIDDAITRFLEPTFADSKYVHVEVSAGPAWLGLVIGALIAIAGVSIAYRIWVRQRGTSARLIERFHGAYVFLSHKWYFDEIIDFLIVRPTLWTGRLVATTLERGVIGGVVTDGTTSVVRAGSAAVRRAQTGFLRYYAALMIVCVFGVALYFLVSST